MAWGSSPVASLAEALGQNGGTTAGTIDSSGADTLFMVVGLQGGTPTVSDSKSNNWTQVVTVDNGFGAKNFLFRSDTPATVGSGHTFTATLNSGLVGIAVTAFAGGATSSIDDQNAGHGSVFASTIAPGSITPTADNTIVITGASASDSPTDPSSIDASFTIAAHVAAGATNYGTGIAYLVQTTAAAANPTWTLSQSATHEVATIASFKAAAGGGGGAGGPITLGGSLTHGALIRGGRLAA